MVCPCPCVPDAVGGGEDGLNNSSVEVHYQGGIFQLPQEVQPPLCFHCEGADGVQEVVG